jgi:hypothetical protein
VKLGSVPDSPLEKTWDEVGAIPKDSPLNCADDDVQSQMIAVIDKAKKTETRSVAYSKLS